MKTIILTLAAAKDLDGLPHDARKQVEVGLHRYAMTGQGDVKALQGRSGYRLRLGGYRGDLRRGCQHDPGDLHWPQGYDDLQEELRP